MTNKELIVFLLFLFYFIIDMGVRMFLITHDLYYIVTIIFCILLILFIVGISYNLGRENGS